METDDSQVWDAILLAWQLGGPLYSPNEFKAGLKEASQDPLVIKCADLVIELVEDGLPPQYVFLVLKSYRKLLEFLKQITRLEDEKVDLSTNKP